MTTIATVRPSSERLGLDILIGDGVAPVVSPRWTVGAWNVQFVRLDALQTFELSESAGTAFVKVITGRLSSIGRGAYADRHEIRTTRVGGEPVEAGEAGSVFALFTAGDDRLDPVVSVADLRFDGPGAEALGWRSYESMYSAATPHFDGLDAHLAPGFHLLDADGLEITYVFTWAAGKGVDMSTHNHGRPPKPTAPAFAEVHWVMHNGTGSGGMYLTPAPGSPERKRFPVQQGEEHGPFFEYDAVSGAPLLRDNGAVDYPWHGWEAGVDDIPGQAYDVVAAFEITDRFALVEP